MIAWEPPALAVLPDGLGLHAQMFAPIEEYLQVHPGDWSGAYDVLPMIMSGGAADLADADASSGCAETPRPPYATTGRSSPPTGCTHRPVRRT